MARWTKETIIEAVKQRLEAHSTTSPRKADPSLYNAARYHFGSWKNAVAAAQGDQSGNQRWTKQRIIERIRYRRSHRQRLDPYAVRREDSPLYGAARYHFGSWPKAVEAAGIPYYRARRKNVRRSPSGTWSPARVIEAIRSFDTPPRLGEAKRYHKRLLAAAEYYFGTWHRACQAAIAPPQNGSQPESASQARDSDDGKHVLQETYPAAAKENTGRS